MEDCVTCRGTPTIEIFSRRIHRFPSSYPRVYVLKERDFALVKREFARGRSIFLKLNDFSSRAYFDIVERVGSLRIIG